MKILSDFDGVLTDLGAEALRVRELFQSFLTEIDAGSSQKLVSLADQALKSEPHRHGWVHQNRISAYSDEDGFIAVNAMGACLDRWALEDRHGAKAIHQKLERGFTGVAHLAYTTMARETSQGQHHPMDSSSVEFLKTALHRGHEVVIVSNSASDRIEQLLATSGLKTSSQLRVRGGANKFVLGDTAEWVRFGDREVDVNRPHYRTIVSEENPDAVVGDVFSLDLALPWQRKNKSDLSTKLFLRKRPYTPAWTHTLGGKCFELIDRLDAILAAL